MVTPAAADHVPPPSGEQESGPPRHAPNEESVATAIHQKSSSPVHPPPSPHHPLPVHPAPMPPTNGVGSDVSVASPALSTASEEEHQQQEEEEKSEEGGRGMEAMGKPEGG